MQNRMSGGRRGLLAVILVPFLAAACASAAEEVFVQPQPAPGEVVVNQRGAITVIDIEVDRLANATEVAFAELAIAFEEREMNSDGIEMEGRDGDRNVEVDIERENDEVLTEVQVSVTRDGITFDQARSSEILRRILALAR